MNKRWYEAHTEIARIAVPLLKDLKHKRSGYPANLVEEMGDEKLADQRWGEILSDIIEALESLLKEDNLSDEEYDIRQKSFELFGKYYIHLWD